MSDEGSSDRAVDERVVLVERTLDPMGDLRDVVQGLVDVALSVP